MKLCEFKKKISCIEKVEELEESILQIKNITSNNRGKEETIKLINFTISKANEIKDFKS